jgi:hypothetical protein
MRPRMRVLHAGHQRRLLWAWRRCTAGSSQSDAQSRSAARCRRSARCSLVCTRHVHVGALGAGGDGGGSTPRALVEGSRLGTTQSAPLSRPAAHPGPRSWTRRDGMVDDRSALTRVHVHKSELHRLRQHESPFCPALQHHCIHLPRLPLALLAGCHLCRLIADEPAPRLGPLIRATAMPANNLADA